MELNYQRENIKVNDEDFMKSSLFKITILSIIILFVAGCARFNTFYNMKKAYDEAVKQAERRQQQQRPQQGNRPGKSRYEPNNQRPSSSRNRTGSQRRRSTGFDLVIEKGFKLITLYPKSKYVDDSLYLIANSYRYKGEYEEAIRKYEEIFIYYPESEFRDGTKLGIGYTHYLMDDYEGAINTLLNFETEYPKSKLADQAKFHIGESYFALERYKKAEESYRMLVEQYPKSSLCAEAQFKAGESAFVDRRYGQAKFTYGQVLRLKADQKLAFEARFRLGECHLKLNEFPPALALYLNLVKEAENLNQAENIARCRLKIAQCSRHLEGTEAGLANLNLILEDQELRTVHGETQYEIGLIYQEDLGDLEKAREAYDAVRGKAGSSSPEVVQDALKRSNSIAKLSQFKPQQQDSTSMEMEVTQQAKTRFLLAETFYFQLSETDSALVQYQSIVNDFPQSDYAPKGLYSIARIYQSDPDEEVQDSTKANEMYKELIELYPETIYSNTARQVLGLPTIEIEVKEDPARTLFLAAEANLKKRNIDQALDQYLKVIEEYPNSPYLGKAWYARAWIYEHYKNEPEIAATLYQAIKDSFPSSNYALAARKKTGTIHPKNRKDRPPEKSKPEVTTPLDSLSKNLEQPDKPEPPSRPRRRIDDWEEEKVHPILQEELENSRAEMPELPTTADSSQIQPPDKLESEPMPPKIELSDSTEAMEMIESSTSPPSDSAHIEVPDSTQVPQELTPPND